MKRLIMEAVPAKPLGKNTKIRRPRILLVTPELDSSRVMKMKYGSAPKAKAGGLAEAATLLFDSLSEWGADVHIAMPYFRELFRQPKSSRRLHLCQDREFCYRKSVYEGCDHSNRMAALAFQRDVINRILPEVRPDIVHCHDWMTGLIPAAAGKMGIKSLFTIHNLHDDTATLAEIEDRGIDSARFWDRLYFDQFPSSYEETRSWNPISFMGSGILASDQVNTVSPTFLQELIEGHHPSAHRMIEPLRTKFSHGLATGIINAPSRSWDPLNDPALEQGYDYRAHHEGKRINKIALQRACDLQEDENAPLLFWPSRLDPVQKGCQLLAEILFQIMDKYSSLGLQVIFVADGPFQKYFRQISDLHSLSRRMAVLPFRDSLSHQAYAASDFLLMPSAYEPCGLAQMVGLRYGSLPIVFRAGGLRDTVHHLDLNGETGNGFVFETHDSNGLGWAIDQAMDFYQLDAEIKNRHLARIMTESAVEFSPSATARQYVALLENIHGGPVC